MKVVDIKQYQRALKPKTKDNYIGLEIECFGLINEKALAFVFNNHGIICEIKDDGSIDSDFEMGSDFDGDEVQTTFELCFLLKEKEFVRKVKKICQILKQLDIRVNDTCGLHVHLDMRNRNVKKSYASLVKSLPRLTKYVKHYRLNSSYCRLNVQDNYNKEIKEKKVIETDMYGNRYERVIRPQRNAINALSYKKHKTLEVRLHHGTINEKEIITWVKELLKEVKK